MDFQRRKLWFPLSFWLEKSIHWMCIPVSDVSARFVHVLFLKKFPTNIELAMTWYDYLILSHSPPYTSRLIELGSRIPVIIHWWGHLLTSAPYIYPLVMTDSLRTGKSPCYLWENPLFLWWYLLAMFIYQILYNQTPWIMAGNTTTTHLKIQSSTESRGEMVVARSASTCFASCALSLWWPSPAWPPRMRRGVRWPSQRLLRRKFC